MRNWKPRGLSGSEKVSVVVATYEQTDCLLSLLYGLRAQTYQNWEAIVVHDGPGPTCRRLVDGIGDARIVCHEAPEHGGHFGHEWRAWGLERATGAYVGMTNGDNWYAPVYFEWMLSAMIPAGADLAYANMIHSHHQWAPFKTVLRVGQCDLGAWIATAALARAVPWPGTSFEADGQYIEAMARLARRVVHVPGHLFVHN